MTYKIKRQETGWSAWGCRPLVAFYYFVYDSKGNEIVYGYRSTRSEAKRAAEQRIRDLTAAQGDRPC